MNNYHTLQEGKYVYIKSLGYGEHLLYSQTERTYEVWFANKNHASYGLIWRNTHLEFAREYHPITPLEKAVMTCNKRTIEEARKEQHA